MGGGRPLEDGGSPAFRLSNWSTGEQDRRIWERRQIMRKLIVALVAAGALTVVGAGPAFGAEHHPPKFNVKSNQCSSDANQPNCPGNH